VLDLFLKDNWTKSQESLLARDNQDQNEPTLVFHEQTTIATPMFDLILRDPNELQSKQKLKSIQYHKPKAQKKAITRSKHV
jgi:hypothetical protein